MLILAAVPTSSSHKLRRAAAARFSLARATSGERRWPRSAAARRSRGGRSRCRGAARAQGSNGCVCCFLRSRSSSTPASPRRPAAVLLSLGQRGIRYHRVCGALRRRSGATARGAGPGGGSRRVALFLEQSAGALAPLASELALGAQEAFQAPDRVQTVGQTAAGARVDRRTCERWFTRVGLPTRRQLPRRPHGCCMRTACCRIPGSPLKTWRSGSVTPRSRRRYRQHAGAYLGLTAGEMRLSLTPEQALDLVAQRFLAPTRLVSAEAS